MPCLGGMPEYGLPNAVRGETSCRHGNEHGGAFALGSHAASATTLQRPSSASAMSLINAAPAPSPRIYLRSGNCALLSGGDAPSVRAVGSIERIQNTDSSADHCKRRPGVSGGGSLRWSR